MIIWNQYSKEIDLKKQYHLMKICKKNNKDVF